ncbi:beta strand repeat-containing protein [Maribacter dokdonensis]|uniref:beta strand repeat-containing protein n=1 Tax=Maribacter dokdonensis TaxID=320912 RepID=UPI002732E000|nr:hypothetical protein [Maribacter dokdonensis]MDP2527675.1 hypothetical protein [Maribacter dokdonensis]
MSSKIKFLLFFSFISFCATAQVKIGQNPNTIHSASIVELESSDKAFVLTRLSTAQMQAITPLNGAVVYNTDTQCVHYFNGTVWTNLCDDNNTNDFSFTDNSDGTITLDDGNGNTITFNGAAQTISTLIDNGDDTYTYTNENGIETVISIAVTDNQNLQTDNTPGNISIDNGNALTINVDDADADAQNEIQTLDYTSGVLTLSNDPNATVVDLSAFDQNAADDFSGSYNDLSDLPINLDTDATDDFNTAITFDGTNLTVSDAGGDVSTDISGLAYDDTALRADVDQNTADIDALETEQTTQNNSIATNATDIDNLEAEQTTQNNSIATNATDIDNLEAEQTTQNTNIATNATDIDNLEAEQSTQNNSITTNATDISTNTAAIAAHNSADGDLSDSNEFNTGISFDGTDLTVTDLGGDQTVDISGLAYDDTALRADVDQNTADIDALEAEQTTQNTNIATNASDIDTLEAEQTTQNTNIATNATDIDNLEAEQTTQNNSIATNATDIDALETEQTTQNNSIATNATDIDNLEAEQTTQNNSIATNATDIDNLEAEQSTQNNSITTNATDISTNAAAIAAHNTADGDLSDSNEYNTGISFDGTDLTVTDLGGDQTVDISGLAYDDTALRANVDQNTADIDALETEQTTQNNSIATNATDISTNATAIAAHNSADGDLSDSNEYNTGISFDGTDLTVTDGGGDQTVDISGLAYDDTALRADVDQNTADIDALEAEQTTQNTNIATNATDIDNLEAEQTTQNNSIATNASDISTNAAAIAAHNSADGDLSDSNEYNTGISFNGTDLIVTDLGGDQTVDISGLAYDDTALRADVDQNTADIDALETEQTTQNTNIATNATDIDNLEAEQTTQNNSIATNAADIDALEAEQTTQNNSIATNVSDIDALEAEQTTQNTNIATNATDIDNLEAEQTTQNNSIATNASDISTNAAAIAAHNSADGDLSDSNEYNTGISFNGTDLTVTDLGGDQTVDISGLAYDDTALRADVDQNTADIDALEAEQTTQNTNIATNATDIDNIEAEQTTQNNSIATNATDIDNLEAEQITQNNSIATNATDISTNTAAIAAHNTADGDLSDSNEYNTGISFDGTDLTVTDLGGDQTVDISGLAYDDAALRADVDQNTADIDALEAEQTTQNNSIASNATDIDNLEAEQTTQNNAIATNTTDIDNLEAEQTSQNNSIATNATDIDALEAEQTTQNNSIATNATDISTNTAAIAAHNTADGDLSDSNEYNTGISFDGTDLTVTDGGGDQTVDISGLAYNDTALRADVDQNTADIDALEAEQTTQNNSIATNATDIDNLEAEQTTQNNSIATNDSDIDNLEAEQTTQNNSIATNTSDISSNTAAIAAHNSADGDLSDSNEYNTGISFDGTDLTVTDLGGDQTVDISGLAYDDAALRADVDQNTADIDALEAEQTTQNNSIASNATDIDNLEAEQTTQNNSIATNATDIDNLEAEQTTQNNSIATNATDIDNLEAEQTTQNNSIATNATDISTNTAAIAAHNSADGDLSNSNEYNTGISFDGTDLTVTDLGGDQTVDISGLAYDDTALRTDVDQNTADIDALETEQTTQNNSITTNATDISTNTAAIAAHNTADGDLSDSNEYNTGISFDGTDLTVTDLGGDQTVDISGLAYDDTAIRADVDQNTTDIDALEAEQTTQNNSIATNATDISTNTAAIAAHNTADGDLSDSNEFNTGISFDGTDLTVTDLGGDQTVDISGLAYDDTALRADVDQNTADIDTLETEQTTQNTNIATNATDIDNLEAEQTTQNNSIATNATDISTNIAAIAAHNTADGDLSDSNEFNTGISFDGTDLTVTDGGGDQTVDISGLAYDDTALRADVDQNTADIDALETEQTTQNTNIATNATDIDNLEAEQTTQNNSIATNATDIDNLEAEQTTQNNSISSNSAAIAAHNTADEDLSATNETNTSFSTVDVAGTDYLRISDSNGDLDVPLSDLSHTGTTGSVFFAGADGTPTENNGQLFWNSSSNSLGIGTSSPTNKLHVSGAIRSQGILNSNGTENEPAYRFNDDTNTGMFRPAADEIAFTVGGIEAMKIEETSSDTSVIINETLELEGAILDENDSPGTAGQVLTSTATGTEWVNSMSPIKAIGKISAAGGVTKATAGVTVTRISVGYYRVTLPTGAVSDADYIIQLTQPGRGGAGNDDPGISYSNQTANSFEVIIGDNDNGGTDRSRFDSEFMFTVLDL